MLEGFRLAEEFTVVATDLRGYGDSGKPRGLPDHSNAVDFEEGRKIACPVLVIVGGRSHTARLYG